MISFKIQKIQFLKMNKNLTALILFFVFWSSFVILTGTLTSGFHFTDDHEIITINKNIHDNGLFNATKSTIRDDLTMRFRPFYFLHKIIIVKLFGTNFLLWSIYNAILAIFTSFFLFLFIYRQGYKFIHALIFPFITLIGAQSAIWWRLGPNETIGLFLLSASLFFLANSIFGGQKYQLLISAIFIVLASLSKESFTIFIPAYILILLWFKWQRHTYNSVADFVRSNIIFIICLLVVLAIEFFIIIFVVGTHKIGYAGIDNSFSVSKYLTFVYSHLQHNKYTYLIFFGLFLLLHDIKSWKINRNIDLRKGVPYFSNVIILMAIILPQYLLYNKSEIYERYLLPLNLGLSFFVIFLAEKIYASENISLLLKRAYILFIIIVTFIFLKNDAVPNAKVFAKEGIYTNKFLSSIIANTKTDDSILVVLNDYKNYEWGFSINYYLAIEANRKNITYYTVNTQLDDDLAKDIDKRFSQAFNSSIVKELSNNFSCIAILPFSENKEIKDKLDSNYVYQRSDFDNFTVYTKKGELHR